jgi:DNA-directed RNA polymerase subunit RPC12/RpoP
MNSILIALISVSVILIVVILALITLITKVNRIVELLEEEEEEENDDVIDCPHCKSTHRLFVPIHWNMTIPNVGQCPECTKTWQNTNTKEFPHLREVK